MTSFRLCYDLKKRTSDRDSILRLHAASWAIAAIRPLIRVNIYDIIRYDVIYCTILQLTKGLEGCAIFPSGARRKTP
jgi:hypothetical protein